MKKLCLSVLGVVIFAGCAWRSLDLAYDFGYIAAHDDDQRLIDKLLDANASMTETLAHASVQLKIDTSSMTLSTATMERLTGALRTCQGQRSQMYQLWQSNFDPSAGIDGTLTQLERKNQ